MQKVGIIGTGMLGNAVGLHLLEKKFEVGVFNRTKEKTKELKDKGAIVYDFPKDVASNVDIVITIVKDAEAVKDVSFGEYGLIHGRHDGLCVADMSTINPLESKKIAKKFEEHKIDMLDTPVMGGPNVAITGDLVLMAGGKQKTFERFKEVFNTISSKNFFLGPNGTAHSVKLAMNLQIAMLALALSEGIILAKSSSIDPNVFLKILNSTYFKTGMSENKAYKMIKDEFKPTFTLQNLTKDLSTINETANLYGIKLPMSTLAESIYQKAAKEDFKDLDYTGILSFLKEYSKNANLQNDFKH